MIRGLTYIQIRAGPTAAIISQTAVFHIPRRDPRFSERCSDRTQQFKGSDGLGDAPQFCRPTPAMQKDRNGKRPDPRWQPQFTELQLLLVVGNSLVRWRGRLLDQI